MISRAWYVRCDLCGNPADISTESAKHARRIARGEGFQRKRVAGKMLELCRSCLPDKKEQP